MSYLASYGYMKILPQKALLMQVSEASTLTYLPPSFGH